MKIQLEAFIGYEKPWRADDSGFRLYSFDPSHYSSGTVLAARQMVEVEVPDNFDPRPQMVKALEAEKEKARADFSKRVMEIDKRINELMALEHTA